LGRSAGIITGARCPPPGEEFMKSYSTSTLVLTQLEGGRSEFKADCKANRIMKVGRGSGKLFPDQGGNSDTTEQGQDLTEERGGREGYQLNFFRGQGLSPISECGIREKYWCLTKGRFRGLITKGGKTYHHFLEGTEEGGESRSDPGVS